MPPLSEIFAADSIFWPIFAAVFLGALAAFFARIILRMLFVLLIDSTKSAEPLHMIRALLNLRGTIDLDKRN